MSGTFEGGRKAAKTNKEKYGDNFFRVIGSKGGQVTPSKPRGFATNPALARVAGAKGGRMSNRKGVTNGQGKEKEYVWEGGPNEKLVFAQKEQ